MIAFLLFGCGEPREAIEHEGVEWLADGQGFVFAQHGHTKLRWPLSSFSVGVVSAIDPALSYDPWWTDTAVNWHPAVSSARTGPAEWLFDHGDGISSALSVVSDGPTRFSLTWVPSGDGVAYLRLAPRTSTTEAFYGLGEWFDRPDHRGQRRAMQVEIDVGVESLYNEVHVPIPFLVGTEGWGLFVDDRHPSVFDVASQASDLLEVTVGLGPDGPNGLQFHLFGRDRALDVTRDFHAVTGSPKLPAPWAWGPLLWRDENVDQAEVEADLTTVRELDLAASGVWVDRPYATGVNTFDFSTTQFPDPAGMITMAQDLGFRMGLWHTPYVSETEAADLHETAQTQGYFAPERPDLVLNGWGTPIDFSNPAAMSWWQDNLEAYEALGIEGYKLDYGEDIVLGANGGRLPWRFYDGTDERTMHKRYPELYHAAYEAALPDDGGFLLCRAAVAGDQVRARVLWPGDLAADLSFHREPRVGDDGTTYASVGGLPAAVSAALSTSVSGFPMFGSDTGGYKRSPPDDETWRRWFAHTALSSMMQVGNGASVMPWELSRAGWSEASLTEYRAFSRLHLRLFPYGWSVMAAGDPLMRPFGLVFPELGVNPPDAYLFGEDLLVAPVVVEGAVDREVVFPDGNWTDWWTGQVTVGPATVVVPAPLGALPLFLRAGAIVPLLRPTIDTLAPTTDPTVDSFDTDAGALWVRVAAGPSSQRALYDHTVFDQQNAGPLSLSWTEGDVFRSGGVVEWVGVVATEVSMDGAVWPPSADGTLSGWSSDGVSTLVSVPAGGHLIEVYD